MERERERERDRQTDRQTERERERERERDREVAGISVYLLTLNIGCPAHRLARFHFEDCLA